MYILKSWKVLSQTLIKGFSDTCLTFFCCYTDRSVVMHECFTNRRRLCLSNCNSHSLLFTDRGKAVYSLLPPTDRRKSVSHLLAVSYSLLFTNRRNTVSPDWHFYTQMKGCVSHIDVLQSEERLCGSDWLLKNILKTTGRLCPTYWCFYR